MSQKHEHSHDIHKSNDRPNKGLHRDWRFWAVILMLVGMVIYVVTLDEALGPGNQAGEEVPAMAE
jgi:hypothetical protein